MPDETITFELIRRVDREEQRSPKLSNIPDDFYSKVVSYINQKKKLAAKEDRKDVLELKSVERLVADIFDRRERKIVTAAVNAARTNIKPENMVPEEEDFFDLMTATIRQRRDESLKKMLTSEKIPEAELIVFKEDVPEFVGSDMKNYGPFKKGDIAKLPDDNVKVLTDRGVAEQFKVAK